jgi:hypothetical protein
MSVQRCWNGEAGEWINIIANHKKTQNYGILEIVI